MPVKIITDSASDIPLKVCKKLNIEMLHLRVNFGDEEYLDGLNLTHEEFFEKLIETDEFPKTSQISPYIYEEIFKSNTSDDIVFISVSSKLSGCYNSAATAVKQLNQKNIYLIDSENASLGQYALVMLAVRLRNEGKTGKEIKDALDIAKKKLRLVALIDTLEYLQKGGRLSKGAALIGSLISIKPVIGVIDGEVEVLGKARGSKKGNNLLTEIVMKSGGINYDYPIVFAYSGLSDGILNKYISDNIHLLQGKINPTDIPKISIGAAIGSHVGPGGIGVAFFAKDEFFS